MRLRIHKLYTPHPELVNKKYVFTCEPFTWNNFSRQGIKVSTKNIRVYMGYEAWVFINLGKIWRKKYIQEGYSAGKADIST